MIHKMLAYVGVLNDILKPSKTSKLIEQKFSLKTNNMYEKHIGFIKKYMNLM